MPTIERTTTGMQDPTSTEIENLISNLKSKLVAGRIIYASDINQLISLWNRFNDHYHRADDLYGIDNYGNVHNYGGSGVYDTVNEATNRLQDNGGWTTNQADINTNIVFTAEFHNQLSNRFNSANNHLHTFNDRTG